MPEAQSHWNRNPDHDVRATPEQIAFAKKRDAKAAERKTATEAKATKQAAEEALYDEGIGQIKAEEASRNAHNHRLSPGDH